MHNILYCTVLVTFNENATITRLALLGNRVTEWRMNGLSLLVMWSFYLLRKESLKLISQDVQSHVTPIMATRVATVYESQGDWTREGTLCSLVLSGRVKRHNGRKLGSENSHDAIKQVKASSKINPLLALLHLAACMTLSSWPKKI
jgi:hypothetical protein